MTTIIPLQTMSCGDSRKLIIDVKTPVLEDDDISTYEFTWRLWHILKGYVLEKTVGHGITILNQVSYKGKLQVELTRADTEKLAPLVYFQELRMFYGNDEIKIGEGVFMLDPARTIPATV